MELRPYSPGDLAALIELQHAYESAWFGAPQQNEDEVREAVDKADAVVLAVDDGRVVGAAYAWRTGAHVIADRAADSANDAAADSANTVDAVFALLLPWLRSHAVPEVEALDREVRLIAALERFGWRYAHSAYDLHRTVTPELVLPEPRWPDGVELRPWSAEHEAALHHLVYVDAAWAEVPGHHARDLAEWRRIFLAGRPEQESPLVAWRGERPVGVALIRYWSDGTGWVAQLAVARDERGRGLGRSLLATALRRMVAGGASGLGLSVMGDNRGALAMYLDAGLPVEREWRTYLLGP